MRNTFILVSLLSYSFLIYLPLDEKKIGLNSDDLCYYEDGDKQYVKPCNEGYSCNIISDKNNKKSGICLEYKPRFKKYKEKCNQNSDCYPGLKCDDKNECVQENNEIPYIYTDKVSEKKYYYCPDDRIPINETLCQTKDTDETKKDKCPINENMTSFSYDYLNICGELNEEKTLASNSGFGIVDDGKYVGDILACKSGFALFFSKDGNTTFNNNNENKSLPLCVTAKYAEKDDNDKCIIGYTKGDDEKELIYNESEVDGNLYRNNSFIDCNLIMTQIELLKNYLNIFNKLNAHCKDGQFYNEPFTCENDELRKSWYYYNHPDHYLLYKDEQEIIDYLIQRNYPTHISNEIEQEDKKDSSSGFLNNKYFLILLLLFI